MVVPLAFIGLGLFVLLIGAVVARLERMRERLYDRRAERELERHGF